MFRGLTTKKENACEFNETWVEGDLIHSRGKVYIHPVNNCVSIKGELGSLIIMHEVQPDTVTQIAGLQPSKSNVLAIEYERFEEDDVTVLSVVDREADKVLKMFNGEEAENLYKTLTEE